MHFEIAYKWVFLLLPLPLLVYWLLPALRKRRSGLIVPFFNRAADLSEQRVRRSSWVSRRNIFGWIILWLCWLCLIAAASSPQYVGQPAKKVRTVRSFLIAADISFSMAQTDWVVGGHRMSRWGAVKYLMSDFVKERKSDQIGLVMFGSHAYLQAPLTTDLNTITWLLNETEVGMAGQMTSIGEAIAFGIKVFKEDTIKQKIMLLMTDGIDGGKSISPTDAAEAAKKDSIVIYTLGIGRSGTGSGYDLDEKTLRDIANITGGKYFNAMTEGEMKDVYKELNKLQPVEYEEENYRPVTLLYMYPLAAGLALTFVFHFMNGLVRMFWRREV